MRQQIRIGGNYLLNQMIEYFQTDSSEFIGYLVQHIKLSLIALTIAICIGIPLGYISYRNKKLGEVLTTSSQLLRIIPSLAVLFILIPIIGVGELPALIALTFLAIPPIIMNTILGMARKVNAISAGNSPTPMIGIK